MLIESTKKITTGHYLVTDPNSEFLHKTLKVQSGVYNHLGEQVGVCLEINEDLHTVSFMWSQLLRVEPLTDEQKQAYYYEQEVNPYFEHL